MQDNYTIEDASKPVTGPIKLKIPRKSYHEFD